MLDKKKIFPVLFVVVVFLGAFAFISNVAANDEEPNEPKLMVIVSQKAIRVGEIAQVWCYIENPTKTMERTGHTIHHSIALTRLTFTSIDADGSSEKYVDYQDIYPQRWNPIIKPREKVLVFYMGWFNPGPMTGVSTLTFTFEADYDGTTITLEETVKIQLKD